MPNRSGKTMKKRQNRDQRRQESKFEDKVSAAARNQGWMSPIDWLSGDDFDEDDSDQYPPKDFYTSNKYKTKKTRHHRQNVPTQPSTVTKNSSQPHETYLTEYAIRENLNDHQPPSRIFDIFSNVKSKREVMKILKGIQDEEDRYWQSKDEKLCSRQVVIEHFQQIQNHDGMWNAPMSYRKIDENYQWETIIETVSRGFNKQIRAKHQLTDEIFECYDLHDDQHLDSHKYIEKHTDNGLIGLFISQFDKPIIEFELHNTYENQVCQWISIDDIINQRFGEQFDLYRTLRPFVQYLFDLHFNSNDDVQQGPKENEMMFQNNLNLTVDAISTINLNTAPRNTPLCIRDELFHSAQLLIEFQDDRNQMMDESLATILVDNYVPKILAAFNLSLRLPKNHMSIPDYAQCVLQRLEVPYYKKPRVNSMFPFQSSFRIFGQPKKTSILPLLIIAQRNRVNIQNYDIISERNSLRKIAMNNENYVIDVKRIGSTLFVRRHDKRINNKNDVGFRFEQMCRPDYHLDAEFKLLVESSIGNLRILITAETDVVCEQTNQLIELKSRLHTNTINQKIDCWLQAFLVIVGHRTDDEPPRLVDIREYDTPSIVNDEAKQSILLSLYRVLCFLRENIKQDGTYLFWRRYDSRVEKDGLYLYKVANKDEQELTFVTSDLLNQLGFNL